MLVVTFHNDGTGTDNIGNYDVKVLITLSPTALRLLWEGRVESHNMADGWQGLVQRFAAGYSRLGMR